MREDKYWRFEIDVDGLIRIPSDETTPKPHRTVYSMVDSVQNVGGHPKRVVLVFNFVAKIPHGLLKARMMDELSNPASKFHEQVNEARIKLGYGPGGSFGDRTKDSFSTVDFLLKFLTQPWVRRHSKAHSNQIIKELIAGKGSKENPVALDSVPLAPRAERKRKKAELEIGAEHITIK